MIFDRYLGRMACRQRDAIGEMGPCLGGLALGEGAVAGEW